VANPPADFDGTALIGELLARINENWIATDRPVARSCENWRFAKMLAIDADNRSPEKRLEKAIVLAADDSWANQIPTASGLLDSSGRQCNIDLAKRQSSEYWLFELKCESDHPISAAMQHRTAAIACRYDSPPPSPSADELLCRPECRETLRLA
jgi:hypothetical protein